MTHRSLFDGTLQGINIVINPAFGFQGHPEASPGPHDVAYLFDEFRLPWQMIKKQHETINNAKTN